MTASTDWPRRLGLLAAVAGPPAVAATVWQSFVSAHPVLAVATFLVYEFLVVVLRYAGDIASDVGKLWKPQLAQKVDKVLRLRMTQFGSRYRQFILDSHEFMDEKGLGTTGFFAPHLDEVYVDVSVAYRAPHETAADLLANPRIEPSERRTIEHFLDGPDGSVLVVLGAPGSGKTTLLRRTARQVCRAERGQRRTVPILLYLRDHAATLKSNPNIGLADITVRSLRQFGMDESPDWFTQQLRRGNCVVLLDGLDEVGGKENRERVVDWVDRQVVQHSKRNDFVITSRPHGYLNVRISGDRVLNVLAFTDDKVTEFVHSWYVALLKRSNESADEHQLHVRATASANDLLDRLNSAPALYELTVNPLLLTMIVNVHRYRGVLPGSRVRLYQEICQVMLGLRQEAKKLPIDLDGDRKETLLRSLAYTMMKAHVLSLSRAEVIQHIRPALRRMSRDLTVEAFLADVASNGLMVERENDVYSFAHLTFQEYLAAMHVRSKGLIGTLTANVGDSWWRETILLYTAKADADDIVRACLESATVPALALAFECTEDEDNSELAPELREYLDNLLASAYGPETRPDLRHLMAGVLLTRHLRRLVRVGGEAGLGRRVCPAPITNGLYWFFEQEVTGHRPDRRLFPEPVKDRPVVGVRAADAQAFIAWANDIVGSGITYRAPTTEELHDPSARRLLKSATGGPPLAVWALSGGAGSALSLWVGAAPAGPHRITADDVIEHVERDLKQCGDTLARLLLIHAVIANRVLSVAIDQIIGLTHMRTRFDIPHLDSTLQRARARAVEIKEIRSASGELDAALSEAVALDRRVHVHEAYQLAQEMVVDLTQRYDPSAVLGVITGVDLPKAPDVAGVSVDDPGGKDSSATVVDRTLALDTVLTTNLHELFQAASVSADSDNESVSLDAYLALEAVIGSALSYSVTAALQTKTFRLDDWERAFGRMFLESIKIDREAKPYEVAPDSLAERIEHACRDTLAVASLAKEGWTQRAVANFQAIGIPVAGRAAPINGHNARAVRLAALCLAAQADLHRKKALSNQFREIAAGITLLEQRAQGSAEARETILLATS